MSQVPDESEMTHLVHKTDKFAVWVDKDMHIDWWTSDEYDATGPTDLQKHNAVMNRVADLECIPNEHLEKTIRLNFKRMIGEAISRSLKDDYENAEEMLKKALAFIRARNEEMARYWQLLATAIMLAILLLWGVVTWGTRANIGNTFGQFAVTLSLSAICGGVGSSLSMILRMGNYKPAKDATSKLHFCEAVSKIVAGIICGGIAAFALKAGFIISPAIQTQSPVAVVALTAVAAGACERWIPSLISKIPNDTPSA